MCVRPAESDKLCAPLNHSFCRQGTTKTPFIYLYYAVSVVRSTRACFFLNVVLLRSSNERRGFFTSY